MRSHREIADSGGVAVGAGCGALYLGAGVPVHQGTDAAVYYTAQNPFERFPDGRSKVPDDLLAKLKEMSAEEVLGLAQRGFRNQWEAGWQILHPQKRLIGRALTVQMMPTRPDVSEIDATDRRARICRG